MKEVTEIYRRSDALFYSTQGRRELCDIIARMEAERGMCEVTIVEGMSPTPYYVCKECGKGARYPYKFCPNCGRYVVHKAKI